MSSPVMHLAGCCPPQERLPRHLPVAAPLLLRPLPLHRLRQLWAPIFQASSSCFLTFEVHIHMQCRGFHTRYK